MLSTKNSEIEYSRKCLLFVLPVVFYRTEDGQVATESSFLQHLRLTLKLLSPQLSKLHIASPSMSAADYSLNRHHLGHFNEDEESIHWTELTGLDSGRLLFAVKHSLAVSRALKKLISQSAVVQSGISMDIYRPFEFISMVLANRMRKKTIFVVDIDERESIHMQRRVGNLSMRKYWSNRLLFDPLRSLQIKWAVRRCSLVLLKGRALANDYGKGRSNVHNFYDVSFSKEHLISAKALANKIESIKRSKRTLRIVYFGRLVGYKGIDHCIKAVAYAHSKVSNIHLTIIGDGPERARLEELIDQMQARSFVSMESSIPFGQELFDELYSHHILIATPLSPDTPRSVFDAMAAGCAVIAYDTEYYESLKSTGAVFLTPWSSIEALGDSIVEASKNRESLAIAIAAASQYASRNTQEDWMERRLTWIRESMKAH